MTDTRSVIRFRERIRNYEHFVYFTTNRVSFLSYLQSVMMTV